MYLLPQSFEIARVPLLLPGAFAENSSTPPPSCCSVLLESLPHLLPRQAFRFEGALFLFMPAFGSFPDMDGFCRASLAAAAACRKAMIPVRARRFADGGRQPALTGGFVGFAVSAACWADRWRPHRAHLWIRRMPVCLGSSLFGICSRCRQRGTSAWRPGRACSRRASPIDAAGQYCEGSLRRARGRTRVRILSSWRSGQHCRRVRVP